MEDGRGDQMMMMIQEEEQNSILDHHRHHPDMRVTADGEDHIDISPLINGNGSIDSSPSLYDDLTPAMTFDSDFGGTVDGLDWNAILYNEDDEDAVGRQRNDRMKLFGPSVGA